MEAIKIDHRFSLLADRHARSERHIIGNVSPHVTIARLQRTARHRLGSLNHHHDFDVVRY